MNVYKDCATICLAQSKNIYRRWEYDRTIYELVGIDYTKNRKLICCYTFKVIKKNCDYNDDKNCILVVSKHNNKYGFNDIVESFYYDELTNTFINKNKNNNELTEHDEEMDMLTSSCCVIC
jgi:hypothetical protein